MAKIRAITPSYSDYNTDGSNSSEAKTPLLSGLLRA